MDDQNIEIGNEQMGASKKSSLFIIVGVVVLAVVVIGVGVVLSRAGGKPATLPAQTEQDEESIAASDETVDDFGSESQGTEDASANVSVLDVEGGMFYFSPNEIRVKRGEPVTIVLSSVEGMHDFVIDEFDARTDIVEAGGTAEVTFVADEVGEYEFYCSVANHRAMGMVGTLIVEE